MAADTAYAAPVRGRAITLTREGGVFRLAFRFDRDLVTRCKDLPYATFDGDTKSWTTRVCDQSVQQLRRMWHEGLVDVGVDTLLQADENIPVLAGAVLRAGTRTRPFLVHFATRSSSHFPSFRAVPGAQWEKKAGALSYTAPAAAALAEFVDRGLLDDPDQLLSPAEVTVTFDGRVGRFAVRGNPRAAHVFADNFPNVDVIANWQAKNLDVAFLDDFSEQMYRGELARVGDGYQPPGLQVDLFPYQKQSVALALERDGLGVYHAPGLGKCLSPDTPVWVNGTLTPIEHVWREHASRQTLPDGVGEWAEPTSELRVHALDNQHRAVTGTVARLYRQRVRETLRKVTLTDGSSVTITAAHKLLTENRGWTTDLRAGDMVAVPNRVTWQGNPVDPDVTTLLAWQISEGHERTARNGSITITQDNAELLSELRAAYLRIAERYDLRAGTARVCQYGSRAPYLSLPRQGWRALLESWGYAYGHKSAGKTIPDFITRGDDQTVRLFLRHYFAAEGSVGAVGVVEISSASKHLMSQLSMMLRRYGVHMVVQARWKAATNGTRIKRPYWVGTITGMSLARFNDEVGIADPGKQGKLDQLTTHTARTSRETFHVHDLLAQVKELTGLPAKVIGTPDPLGRARSSAFLPSRRLTKQRILTLADSLDALADGKTLHLYQQLHHDRLRRGDKGSNHAKLRSAIAKMQAIDAATAATIRDVAGQMRQRAGADVQWLPVVDITPVEHDGWVYDLEVADHHNFVAGGLYCHNTAIGIASGYELLRRGAVTRVVVVVPAAVRTQWHNEIVRFTGEPETNVVVVRGDKDARYAAYEAAQQARWVVVHYDVLSRDLAQLKPAFAGAFVVADEVHRVKHHTSARSKALRDLTKGAARRMGLSGTPVERDPSEWYEVLSGFCVPGCLGTPMDFLGRYTYEATWGGRTGARNLHELRERSRPFYIRFTKEQVAKHLPPLQVQTQILDPDPAYAAALRRAHTEAVKEIHDKAVAHLEATTGKKAGTSTGDLVLLDEAELEEVQTGASMTASLMLRLLCSSPRLIQASDSVTAATLLEAGLIPDDDGPKIEELRTIGAELLASQERRRQDMADAGITNTTPEMVRDERVVIFTFSKRMANLIAARYAEDGVPHVMFTGDTSADDRDAAVAAFTDPGSDVIAFIATDAAAEGLNLGRCCGRVIEVEPATMPTRSKQRRDRIHRVDSVGRSFQVTQLVLAGTIEHGVVAMAESRADMADTVLGESGGRQRATGRKTRTRRTLFQQALEQYAQDHPTRDAKTTPARGRNATARAETEPGAAQDGEPGQQLTLQL